MLLQLGRYEEAIADYTRSLVLDPRNIKTLNNRGYSFAKSGNYDAGEVFPLILSIQRGLSRLYCSDYSLPARRVSPPLLSPHSNRRVLPILLPQLSPTTTRSSH